MSIESKCVLRDVCKAAGGESCNKLCGFHVALHGSSGKGGRVGLADIPDEYRLLTYKSSKVFKSDETVTIKASVNGKDVKQTVKLNDHITDYLKTFSRQFDEDSEQIRTLYLYSKSPGTGKTTVASSVLVEWIRYNFVESNRKGIEPISRPGYFLDCNEWQTLYNLISLSVGDDAKKPVSDEFQRRMSAAMKAPMAVIDDVGVNSPTEKFRAYLHAVVNHRVANGLPTIFTSNIPMKDQMNVFDARLYDRIRHNTFEVLFSEEGGSKRGIRT